MRLGIVLSRRRDAKGRAMRPLVDLLPSPARWWRAGEAAGVALVLGIAGAVLTAGTAIAGAAGAAAWVKIILAVLIAAVTMLTLCRQFIDKRAERRTTRAHVLETLTPSPIKPDAHTIATLLAA